MGTFKKSLFRVRPVPTFENRLKEIFNYFESLKSLLAVSVIGHVDNPVYMIEDFEHYLSFFEQNADVIPFAKDKKIILSETEKMLLCLKKGKIYFQDFYQEGRLLYRLEFCLVKKI